MKSDFKVLYCLACVLAAAPLSAQTVIPGDTTIQGDLTISESTSPASGSLYVEDDSVIDGSLCIGNTCTTNETFANDVTLRFQYTQNTIEFNDTSGPSNPDRDWVLRINDNDAGGLEKFAVEDATAGTTPFTIAGGAPDNALFLASDGKLGLGTMFPASELHIVGPSFPSIRLEQSTSTGNPASTWRMQGNHNEFSIIRSAASFVIEADAPYAAFRIKDNGDVGLGTAVPEEKLHILTTAPNTDSFALFDAQGAGSDSAFRIRQNGTIPTTWEFRNQQSSGRLNVGIAGGNTPFKIDNLAANNLLRLGRNGRPDEVVVTGTLVVNNIDMNVPDYVFADDYALKPLPEVRAFIDANSHLPDVPSEAEIRAEGVDLTQMQMTLLKKVEELTLYTLEQEARLAEVDALRAELAELKALIRTRQP
ncbi:hypothetical protein BOO69_03285 [Sulfitobacter alexandrii]|uniref:Uncharacterized protein n=1 Tax=Sulfitobacter alexandrii TaxID=1917485 RepID=A0A1J0WE14_9RHOB|nr:hypothetical protein [Sulfitobacter alexandrii]APE42548.1 hypothetical protein BOO69_03285 [Sulfitobacter alexandrii]